MNDVIEVRPLLRTVADVVDYLRADIYIHYKPLADRFEKGKINFSCGNDKWNPDWYGPNAWERRSWPLVLSLAMRVPGVNDFSLWYETDWHHITFTLDGERYDIRWYKAYSLERMGDGQNTTFYSNEDSVVDFFIRKKHLREKW